MVEQIDRLTLGILWDRLISICDEAYQAFLKSAFSPVVRDAYDAVFVIFDSKARLIAQASLGPPSFIGTCTNTINHLLRKYSPSTLKPGDVLATNDPWIGTGQINDLTMVRPIFVGNQLVGFTGTVQHLTDIGGVHTQSGIATEIYEEGLRIPPVKLVIGGHMNEELFELIAYNVRANKQVIGDIKAGITTNILGEKLIRKFMEDYELDNLLSVSEAIISLSLQVMKAKIAELPGGEYTHTVFAEGYEENEEIKIKCNITVENEEIDINFDGSSPAIRRGLNVPFVYTKAYAFYALKCVISPELPNNDGSITPIHVSAPEGSILNALPPVATSARHVIGWFVPMAVWGALAHAAPDRIIAESGMPAAMPFMGRSDNGRQFVLPLGCPTMIGGSGARPNSDGEIMAVPTNVARFPIEVWENESDGALLVELAELVPDSGGAGRFRGGLSTESIIVNLSHYPVAMAVTSNRMRYPAQGYFGGGNGRLHEVYINEKRILQKGIYQLNRGDKLKIITASGGGIGNPRERSPQKLLDDLINGYITLSAAKEVYGVEIREDQIRAVKRALTEKSVHV
ncbi:MAG: hydantoinase B/oxoprolinase family protein [Candidatus Caldarchaeum sp.]